jgi:Predicted Zn-dependent peptidases
MNQLFRLAGAVLLVGSMSIPAAAQQTAQQLSLDPKVKVGTLPNGLTYYIRHNEQPKQRADFYIAQRVGSILEEENQRGLAHFLEHMCFNGTKNFPGNSLIKELENRGVKFGENINAYTSFDETVYNLSDINVQQSTLVDTALLVLHDWSNFVSLTDKDIDDERGVIREEWRTSNDGNKRVTEIYFREVYPNNITGNRIPIGLIDVINGFSHQQLRDYYKKWYRPDLQAIIIVGDIDVNDVEARIKTLFGDIRKPINPAKRTYVQVQNNREPIISIATDPEVVKTSAMLMYKKDIVPFDSRNTDSYYLSGVAQSLIAQMINTRFAELSRQANPPFQGAGSGYGSFMVSVTKDAWTTNASAKSGEALSAFKSLVRENERMRRFGFNASELARAKANLVVGYERAYNERDKQKNEAFVKECIANFTTNEPMPGIEAEYALVKKVLPNLTLDAINKLAMSYPTDTNMVVVITSPKKEGVFIPSKEDVFSAINEVKRENIIPYEDKVVNKPLISQQPNAGKVIKTETAPFGFTKWTLSNGTRVYLKKTDFKKDQILLYAFSEGGTSLFNIKDRPSYSVINEVVPLGGLGEFNPSDLDKVLSGKMAGVSASVSGTTESISGSASPKDFETLMQLTYLKFTQPRKDEIAFKNYLSRKRNQLENAALNPTTALSDSIRATLYDHNPLVAKFDLSMLDKVDYEQVIKLYKERFANAGDFDFVLTGNIDLNAIKPFVETYLGGLSSTSKTEKWRDRGIRMAKGEKNVEFEKELSVPKSTIFMNYSGKAKYSLENSILIDYLTSILDLRYTESIREREGGSYGVSVSGSVDCRPIEQYTLQISFDTDPKLKTKLVGIVQDEIKNLIEKGPSVEDVDKVKAFMLKKNQEVQAENSFWQSMLVQYLQDKIDFSTTYEQMVKRITPEMVKNVAKKWLTQGNIVKVAMNPKSGK